MKVYDTIDEFLDELDDEWDGQKYPVYMTSGGFDPLHIGHLRCILATSVMADRDGGYVVIVVNGDGFLKRKKGKAFIMLMFF